MRRILGILAIALLGLLPLTACGSDDQPTAPQPKFQVLVLTVNQQGAIQASPQQIYTTQPTAFLKVRVTTNNSKLEHMLVSLQPKERHNTEGDIRLTSVEIKELHSNSNGNPDDDVFGASFENELPLGTYEAFISGKPTGAIITVAKSTASSPASSVSVTPSPSASN